jgi:hypothetical protein
MLLEKANRLANLAEAIRDVTGTGHTAAALTELGQDVDKTAQGIDANAALLAEEAMPRDGRVDARRIETVVAGTERVAERVRTNPATVKDGKTWTALRTAAKSLEDDLRKLGIERWESLAAASEPEGLDEFIASLAPDAPDADSLRAAAHELEKQRARETPVPGAAAHLKTAVATVSGLREDLAGDVVPNEIRPEWTALVQGTLPLSRFRGPVEEYVRERGLEKRVRVRLDRNQDG